MRAIVLVAAAGVEFGDGSTASDAAQPRGWGHVPAVQRQHDSLWVVR